MNYYTYEDIEIGLRESFQVKLEEGFVEEFRKFTGDENPLHKDNEYAQKKGYSGIVVFGMLTASYYSTLAGVYLPGEKSLIHSVEIKFMKPVFLNDILTIEGIVTEKNDLFQLIVIKAMINNQNGEKISKALMKVGII